MLHQGQERLVALELVRAALRSPPGVSAEKNEAADALRMSDRVRDRHRTTLRDTEEGEALQLERVDDRFQIANEGVESRRVKFRTQAVILVIIRPDNSMPKAAVSRRGFLKLGAVGASLHALSAVRPGDARTIDVHSHFYPERFLKALAAEGGAPGFQVDFSTPGVPALGAGNARTPLDVTFWDLEKRIERMNAQGVTLHALSLTVPMVHWAPPERGARLAELVNDAMAEAHTRFPDRFIGLATLPVQDPVLALKELERIRALRGIRGVYLPTSLEGAEISDPAFFPLYERCQALELPVFLHPVAVIGADRLRSYYLRNLLGNPFDTALAAANLVFGGVLDRFPTLNVVLPHGGGALPYLVGRLEHGQSVRPEAANAAARPFSEYLRRFYYDTITHRVDLLRVLIGMVGADRVMLGSDFCFDMGYPRPREIVMSVGLPPAEQEKILGSNAARLLRV